MAMLSRVLTPAVTKDVSFVHIRLVKKNDVSAKPSKNFSTTKLLSVQQVNHFFQTLVLFIHAVVVRCVDYTIYFFLAGGNAYPENAYFSNFEVYMGPFPLK